MLCIIGRYPSVSKSNWLHVDIFWFFFIDMLNILYISLDWAIFFLKSWITTSYFSNSTSSCVTSSQISPKFIALYTCVDDHISNNKVELAKTNTQ
jgi:hypothetical protein